MQLPVGGAPHGVAVVDADVLPLLDVDGGPDHHSTVQYSTVQYSTVQYLITTLLSPSKCLLALLMQECSRIEMLAYRPWHGVGVVGTCTNAGILKTKPWHKSELSSLYLVSIDIEHSANIENLLSCKCCLWYFEELPDDANHRGYIPVVSGGTSIRNVIRIYKYQESRYQIYKEKHEN